MHTFLESVGIITAVLAISYLLGHPAIVVSITKSTPRK